MPTETEVIEALRPVQDPELHLSVVDLDMVRRVDIRDATVAVSIALTVSGCPLKAEIEQRVKAAVGALDGVERVEVELVVMTDEDRAALRQKLSSGAVGRPAAAANGGPNGGPGSVPNGEPATAGGLQSAPAGPGHGPTTTAAGGVGPVMPFAGAGSRTRVLGISSGKGGVGKSSVTVNLAIALSHLGHEVAVLDADVYGFSVPKMLGIDQEPVVIDGMIVPPVGHGVKCISTGFFVPDDQPVIWRGPMLHKALEQFLTDVYWGEPDFLLIDMPPGTGDVAMSTAQFMPRSEIFVVTTPQPAAQRVAQRSALMARKVNLSVRGVVENMSWFTGDDGKQYEIFGSGGGQSLADQLGVPLLARIPLVTALREGGDAGAPITVAEPASEAALAFEGLAKRVESLGPGRISHPELKIG